MESCHKIIQTILKIERLEKYLKKDDIFDARSSMINLIKEIFGVFKGVEKILTEAVDSINSLNKRILMKIYQIYHFMKMTLSSKYESIG